jgi:hypothetical protein
MTQQELGEVRNEFQPGLENLIAGVIIGLLLMGGGCAARIFPIYGRKSHTSRESPSCILALGELAHP